VCEERGRHADLDLAAQHVINTSASLDLYKLIHLYVDSFIDVGAQTHKNDPMTAAEGTATLTRYTVL
jgi:hypothetical protein